MKRIYCTDCEGPLSKNDNAFEISEEFIPQGGEFFARVSKYDDWLADVVKKAGYKAGDTLRLILPFFKAYGVTNRKIRRFSASNLLLVPGAQYTLEWIRQQGIPCYIISTSYGPYVEAMCQAVRFPFGNTYCTQLDLGRYRQKGEERRKLKRLRAEIVSMPLLDWPDNASSVNDLSPDMRLILKRLHYIFWREIPLLSSGYLLREVNPIGGFEKANALKEAAEKEGVALSDVAYSGDSITDVDAFRLVRKGGGLAVSFNGNKYAIREAEIAVLSSHTVIAALIAHVFQQQGKEGVLQLADQWRDKPLRELDMNLSLRQRITDVFGDNLPKIARITDENREALAEESSKFRKEVRGQRVGRLG